MTDQQVPSRWRVFTDYLMGLVLLLIGAGLLTSRTNAIAVAIGILAVALGLLLILGRLIAGRR